MARGRNVWWGAGALALGVGAALAGGSGVAQADSRADGTASGSSVGHHQRPVSKPPSRSVSAGKPTRKAASRSTVVAASGTALTDQDKAIAEQDKVIDGQHKVFAHDVRDAVSHFTTASPEVNAGRLYSGSGSAALLDAASAWNGLADNLNAAAQGVDRAVKVFDSATGPGPWDAAVAVAAQPYVGWLSAAATSAGNAAAQASAAAGAFESAFANGVSPSGIAANRQALATLVAINVFGVNLPAIVATETWYASMLVQDVGAALGR